MNPLERIDYVENEERVAWIRRICKGRGLEGRTKGVPFELFGAIDWDDTAVRLEAESFLLPRMLPASMAITNALNAAWRKYGDTTGMSLVERRAMLSAQWGITPRTMDRFELVGARLLDARMQWHIDRDGSEVLLNLREATLALMIYRTAFQLSEEGVRRLNDAVQELEREIYEGPATDV